MSSKKLTAQEILEIREYVKKLRKEGSTSAQGVPGYQTPAAFTGEEGGEGTTQLDLGDGQYAYTEKPPKKKRHFIKLHEVSYKAFKQDESANAVQKINRKILEVNKMIGEISRSLDHSIKLKNETSLDNSAYWKRTNEAILKISKRLSEVNKKARKLANLKELAQADLKNKLAGLFVKAGMDVKGEDVSMNKVGTEQYEIDVFLHGEPYAIDYNNGELMFQDYDKEVRLGNINQESELIKNIAQTLGA